MFVNICKKLCARNLKKTFKSKNKLSKEKLKYIDFKYKNVMFHFFSSSFSSIHEHKKVTKNKKDKYKTLDTSR